MLKQSVSTKLTVFLVSLLLMAVYAVAMNNHALSLKKESLSNQYSDSAKTNPSSVIRTSDIQQTERALKSRDIDSSRTTNLPNGDTLIIVDTPANGKNAQSVQNEMKDDPNFKLLPNYEYRSLATPNDPLYSDGSQWNLPNVNLPQAWQTTTGSPDTVIAVIDSGVLFSQGWDGALDCTLATPCEQPDFPLEKQWTNSGEIGPTTQEGPAPNCTSRGLTLDKACNNLDDDGSGFIDDYAGWDFMGGYRGGSAQCPNFTSSVVYEHPQDNQFIYQDNDPQPYSCDSPTHQNELNRDHYDGSCLAFQSACFTSHGTGVASVAAAATNNGTLLAGANWNAKIMNLRALDGYGYGDSTRVTSAVEYATAMGADVINLSLALYSGGDCTVTDTLLETALADAKAAGVVIVAAAGNENIDAVCYPARSAHAIAVGATNINDARASFSTYGNELDVVAPGQAVTAALSPAKSNNYSLSSNNVSGTSFAAPLVAGIASLVISQHPTASPDDIRDMMTLGAEKVSGMNGKYFTKEYGYGKIDAANALVQRTTPAFESMIKPRDLVLSISTQKTNLVDQIFTGNTYSAGTKVRFDSQATIDGEVYLRSAHDTSYGLPLGIPMSLLKEVVKYQPLDRPRLLEPVKNLQKTDLYTDKKIDRTLTKGQAIYFDTKTYINGKMYLRTSHDTSKAYDKGILYSDLKNVRLTYEPLDRPRELTLKQNTRKTDLTTGRAIDRTLSKGRKIYFDTKVTLSGIMYLRSSYDTSYSLDKGIPYSYFK